MHPMLFPSPPGDRDSAPQAMTPQLSRLRRRRRILGSLPLFLCSRSSQVSGLCPDLLCHIQGLLLGGLCPNPVPKLGLWRLLQAVTALSAHTALQKLRPQPWDGPKLGHESLSPGELCQKRDLHHETHAESPEVGSAVGGTPFHWQWFIRSHQHGVYQDLRAAAPLGAAHSLGHGIPG